MNIQLSQRGLDSNPESGRQGTNTELDMRYQQDAASYIAALLAELRNLSGMAELGKLTHALDSAYYEAYAVAEQRRGPRAKPEDTNGPDV